MSDDEDGLLIPFPRGQFEKRQNEREARFDELPVRRKHDLDACDHRRAGVWVSGESRKVTCRGCGVEMDPIDALMWMAGVREQLVISGQMLRSERDRLYVEVEKLKREERNAKSRIRAARKRSDNDKAIEAALVALNTPMFSYRRWGDLNEYQQGEVVRRARRFIEAFFGELEELREASGA